MRNAHGRRPLAAHRLVTFRAFLNDQTNLSQGKKLAHGRQLIDWSHQSWLAVVCITSAPRAVAATWYHEIIFQRTEFGPNSVIFYGGDTCGLPAGKLHTKDQKHLEHTCNLRWWILRKYDYLGKPSIVTNQRQKKRVHTVIIADEFYKSMTPFEVSITDKQQRDQ